MALIDQIAPRRGQNICIKKSLIGRVTSRLRRLWTQRNHPHITSLTLRQARDIGLDETDLAKRHHQWPSQTHIHPRL